MIKVSFLKKDGSIIGFELCGHSGFAQEGADIICSAVSSAAYMVANTVTEILNEDAAVEVDDGYMKLIAPKVTEHNQVLFKGMALHLNALAQQYEDYLSCKEKLFKE